MWNIGVISYGAGALGFAVLALLLILNWRGRFQGGALIAACVVSAVWAATAAYEAGSEYVSSLPVTLLELVRDWAWAVFFVRLLGGGMAENRATAVRLATVVAYAAPPVLIALMLFVSLSGYVITPSFGFNARVLGFLLLAVLILVLLEQLFRNSSLERRWAIKYLCYGAGIIFVYDFYLYSDALLLKQVDPTSWNARGLVNAIAVPFIAVAAARNPQWSVDVFVSRHVIFHTTAIAGAGVYLLAMALGGYYIRYYGGDWGGVVREVFLVGALVLLVVLLFSGQMRAHLKVLISKHFFNYKYDYREEWLRLIRTLSADASDDAQEKRAVDAMAGMVDSPGGMLFQRQPNGRFVLVQNKNMPNPGEVDVGPLAEYLETWQWVINLEEYADDPKLYVGLELPEWLEEMSQAWLVVPLMLQSGLFGFMVIARPRAKREFNWEDIDLLKTAGRQVAIHLAQAESARALTEARQFEAFNRLSAYVVHDLKNLIAQLSLVAANAKKHKNNPAFMEDAMGTVENAVSRMNRLLVQLRSGKNSQEKSKVALESLLRDIIADKKQKRPVPTLSVDAADMSVHVARDKLFTVIGHLVQNAQEATPDTGTVDVRLKKGPGEAIIEIEDTGCGMDEAFIRERLFRPFDTTKGLTGMGIGVYEAREYIQSLGGGLQVSSRVGRGTLFRVRLPLNPPSSESGAAENVSQVSRVSGVRD